MKTYNITAYYIAEEINLDELSSVIEQELLIKKIGNVVCKYSSEKFLIIYDFGSVVTLDFDEKETDELIKKLKKISSKLVETPIIEKYTITVDPDIKKAIVKFEGVVLKSFDQEKFEIISRVLAQSVGLEYHEILVDKELGEIGKINEYITRFGKLRTSHKNVIKMIGDTSSILQRSLLKMAVLDKPLLTWEYKEMESLFERLRNMFELGTRFNNLKFKIDYIDTRLSQSLDILRSRTEQRLELIIILLIALEVIIYLIGVLRLRLFI